MARIKLYPDTQPAYEWQLAFHRLVDQYLEERKDVIKPKTFVLKASRQLFGKTTVVLKELIRFSLRKTNSVCAYVAPTSEMKDEAFKILTNACENQIIAQNSIRGEIIFENKSRIRLFSAGSQGLRGFTVKDLLVMDEMAFISKDIWEELISAWILVHKPLVIMLSTPYIKDGVFWDYYNAGLNEDPYVTTIDWCLDYSYRFEEEKEVLEEKAGKMSRRRFNCEYLGQGLDAEGSVFGEFKDLIYSIEPVYKQLYMGIDGGTGSSKDYTTIALINENGEVVKLYSFNDISPTQQVVEVKKIINEYKPLRIQADGTSIGKIYKDMMKGYPITGIPFTNERKQKGVEQLVVAFEQRQIFIPNDFALINELQFFEAEKTPTGKITYNAAKSQTDDRITAIYLAGDLYINRNKGTGIRVLC